MVEDERFVEPALTAVTAVLVLVFLSSAVYVFSEGHGSPGSPGWALFMASLVALAGLVLLIFVQSALPVTLTAVLLILSVVSVGTGVYAFAEGHRGMRKSTAWCVCVVASLILAAFLATSYLQFVLKGFPMDW